VRRRRWFFS
jgi:bifunctional non-homologous end joining protein LigD